MLIIPYKQNNMNMMFILFCPAYFLFIAIHPVSTFCTNKNIIFRAQTRLFGITALYVTCHLVTNFSFFLKKKPIP
uniref:Putative product n=1 Tax=Xenopsylla cheopis TaxID=163159 RepID=A0A6M2DXQ2_XENCH